MFTKPTLPTAVLLILVIWTLPAVGDPLSVRDYGAKGDDQTDDTEAFVKALQAGRSVYVPAGTYRIQTIDLPEGTTLHGDGLSSVIRYMHKKEAGKGVEGDYYQAAINLGSSCRVANLRFTATLPFVGDWTYGKAGRVGAVILRARKKQNIEIDRIQIDNYQHTGILLAGCEGVRITNSTFEKMTQAMEIDNSRRIQVVNNRVLDMRTHGIQFWGQFEFSQMLCEDLLFANNYVYHGGSGAIWGTGARRVVMIGNIIDGAHDIGLDLEWCYDCTITGNTTKNCWNAGIALFLSCKNVAISGNSIFIDSGDEGRREGIMLTDVNRNLYRRDFGHRQISITGNTIYAEGKNRHGITIGSGYDIVVAANSLYRADILDRTGRAQIFDATGFDAAAQALGENTKVIPLSQTWRFAIDPDDRGVSQQWYKPGHDDSDWATIRSDRGGQGWERQGFPGKDGNGYAGYAWYRTVLPELPADRPGVVTLHFGMADEQAWIYLDGKKIGEHSVESEGKAMHALWDEPFGIDVSEQLAGKGPHLLAVRVHNEARAGGLRAPVYLICSEQTLDLTGQIRAATLLGSRQVTGAKPVDWAKLLGKNSETLFEESFENCEIGDDPDDGKWGYGKHGNNQWEGDTTYVSDVTVDGVPAYEGSKLLYLEQYTHNNEWDVTGHVVARLGDQQSGVVRAGFAYYPRTGLTVSFDDSENPESGGGSSLCFHKDGHLVVGGESKRSEVPGMKLQSDKWNIVILEVNLDDATAAIRLNEQKPVALPMEVGAFDQMHFRVYGYGHGFLDAIRIVRAASGRGQTP